MGEGMEGITGAEATGRGSSVCAGLLGGPAVWPELVLEGRLKLMDNGLETVATIKIFFCFVLFCWEKCEKDELYV